MYKVKFPPQEKQLILQSLGIRETEPYEIVLCPDTESSEEGKINLIFAISDLDSVREKIQFFRNVTPMVLEGETYRGKVRVQIREINYIESYGNDITAYTDHSRVEIPQKLYELAEQLEPFGFCRISKSQIVNVTKIDAINSGYNGKLTLHLENGQELEVNRSYKAAFREYLKRS